MDTGTWDVEAMDIISAGAAAMGTITVGATGTGTTAGGGVTDTIMAGITAIIIAAGGNPSEEGRQIGGSFFTRGWISRGVTHAAHYRSSRDGPRRDYLSKFRHEGFKFR